MNLKNLFLCDAASINPDNTFSVLRGGINSINIPFKKIAEKAKRPPIRIALVATLELEMTEMGRLHNLELSLLDIDGKKILPDIRSHFQAPVSSKKGFYNIILECFFDFKTPGEYAFYINVDGHELGSHSVYVVDTSSQ